MVYQRDPLSQRFDMAARSFLEQAYEADGAWAVRFIPPPGPRATAWMYAQGFNPYERDRWGELRWIRAYKRAVFWQLKWYGGQYGLKSQPNLSSGGKQSHWGAPHRLQWETGVRDSTGAWAVRIRLHPRGASTSRIGREKSRRRGDNWIDADGHANFRQSTPDERGY